ncbi:ATP phosphoribosyltransferase regulatory subunit [Oceanobacillus jeddahense]|uniref:ATP phosphoribosyltransferase regulatory subunit n=1 Tax=Oceanobacillus jeddahense TaxID=1462527 RepID=A0ABY5JZ41_9BACI|nr:ATP phosphoribosyltransferase regulatory subunit [Oceanobacillus jeddahense]UUI04102.1 ATP phosphoribosyltransferase regulatory subunit [Oceanobacillus jeddahense]
MRNKQLLHTMFYPKQFSKKRHVIYTLTDRFSKFGYQQVETPVFENYDLYNDVQGTVNTTDMLKLIDPTGKVLVLRPDATIPIARHYTNLQEEVATGRLSYVLDIFRYTTEERSRTQAGVELFGERTPEADAELIALAVTSLKELEIPSFKIEIGHATFYKELLREANLNTVQQKELDQYIQSKNISEIVPFLKDLGLETTLVEKLRKIPMLYGDASFVIDEAENIISSDKMREELDYLSKVYQLLQDYQVDSYISINLGLINHMNYYSGIIFQGFAEGLGQPIMMGGRYDYLSHSFQQDTPAIGFAFEVDLLINLLPAIFKEDEIIQLRYEASERQRAFQLAESLRAANHTVIAKTLDENEIHSNSPEILVKSEKLVYSKQKEFKTDEELLDWYLRKDVK